MYISIIMQLGIHCNVDSHRLETFVYFETKRNKIPKEIMNRWGELIILTGEERLRAASKV